MPYRKSSGYKFHRPRVEAYYDGDVDFVVTSGNHIDGTHVILDYTGQPLVRVNYILPQKEEQDEL